MFSSRVEAVAEAAEEQLGSWEPGGGLDVEQALAALPDLWDRLSGSLQKVADKMGDGPFEAAARETFAEAAASVAGLQEEFAHAHQVFRSQHADELRRLEDPRANEQMWDTDKQEVGD